MPFLRWFKSLLSHRGKALALYRSGLAKMEKHDFSGAIIDYSAVIELPDTPADVKAMAIYNRALAYSGTDEDEKAADDLEAALRIPQIPKDVKMAVLRRQERIRRRTAKHEQGD